MSKMQPELDSVTVQGVFSRYFAISGICSGVTSAMTSSFFSALPAIIPAATEAASPFSPPVCGTTTLFTFFTIFPLTESVILSGSAPRVSRAVAAARATAIGSVQPIAGNNSSFSISMYESYNSLSILESS